MTIFSIISSRIMRKKTPGKKKKPDDDKPES